MYCSEVTARLITYLLGIPPELVRPLPMDQPQTILGEGLHFEAAPCCTHKGLPAQDSVQQGHCLADPPAT